MLQCFYGSKPYSAKCRFSIPEAQWFCLDWQNGVWARQHFLKQSTGFLRNVPVRSLWESNVTDQPPIVGADQGLVVSQGEISSQVTVKENLFAGVWKAFAWGVR